jgi:D-xylonate dehydratase
VELDEEDGLIEGGRMAIPEAPGLGLKLDLDVVGEHLVEGAELFDES